MPVPMARKQQRRDSTSGRRNLTLHHREGADPQALDQARGNKTTAARLLRITRDTAALQSEEVRSGVIFLLLSIQPRPYILPQRQTSQELEVGFHRDLACPRH